MKNLILVGVLMLPAAWAWAEDRDLKRVHESVELREKTEIYNFFLSDPSQSKMPSSPQAVELYNDAVVFFQKREYDLALDALRESIALDNKNPLSYELLGDLRAIRHDLDKAKEAYKAAYLIHNTTGLREKIEKIDRELSAESALQSQSDNRFVLKYPKEYSPEKNADLLKLLHESFDILVQEFGYALKEPVVVLLYPKNEFEKITQVPHWVLGLYDGKIKLPEITRDARDPLFKALVMHEMTHVFVGEISRGKAPSWIQEGLARYEENKIRPVDLIVYNAAIKTRSFLPLDELMLQKKEASKEDPLYANLFYDQAFSVANYLVEQFGFFKVKELVEAYGKNKNSEEIFTEHLGVRIDQLDEQWKNIVYKQSN